MKNTISDIKSELNAITNNVMITSTSGSYKTDIDDETLCNILKYSGPDQVIHFIKHLINKTDNIMIELDNLKDELRRANNKLDDEVYKLDDKLYRLECRSYK